MAQRFRRLVLGIAVLSTLTALLVVGVTRSERALAEGPGESGPTVVRELVEKRTAETCGGGASKPAPASPGATSKSGAPSSLNVAGDLLVVRRQDGAWKLVRLTPTSGAEQVLGALPFKPLQALASPSGARVLYVSERNRLAVVDAAAGTVQPISLAGRRIRAIDGATWTSENRFLFGGSRRAIASPQYSALYRADVRTGKVTSFRRLSGGEPSYATGDGSLIYVTRRRVGKKAIETIRRLRSLSAQPRFFDSATAYIDAGRSFNTPLLSRDGAWLLSAKTGTDVSVTYSLYQVRFGRPFLKSIGGSPVSAAWGGTKAAFQQVRLQSDGGGHLAVFVYDTNGGSLTPFPCPDSDSVDSLDWSPEGDLAGVVWRTFDEGEVYASSASNLGEWVDLGAGLVPVWVR